MMRLRFAPSPTGYLHIGNARTAVCNYLIKMKHGASLILRIEDTDMERSTRESEQSILDDLRWLGLQWDEGPDVGGAHGPYRQSERLGLYRKYTDLLLKSGSAYHCYCTPEELEEMRKEALRENRAETYSGRCRNLTDAERAGFESSGRKPTVRFRVPDGQTVIVDDLIRGRVAFSSENIGGDFIIVRSDGMPVYNYIVVIDDTLMEITHVIRGEDHLSNTPKQILIARALNLPVPAYAHHPLMLGPDRAKLSKRHGITSVAMYRKEGYLPEALFNYLAMIGWAAEGGEEILPLGEIVRQVEIQSLAKSAAVFDFQKLRWMNGNYIRSLPVDVITDLFIPSIAEAGYRVDAMDRSWLENAVSLLRGYCEVVSDIQKLIGLLLDDTAPPDEAADAVLREEDAKKIVQAAQGLLGSEINANNYSGRFIESLRRITDLKGKKLMVPLRAIITGRVHGPELDKILPLLGFERLAKRIGYMFQRYAPDD